jgi:hypothetical protein
MNIDEVIEREEALAYSFGERYKRLGEPVGNLMELEQEHQQMADWLNELKTYQEGIEYIKSRINYFSDLGMWDVVNSLELALEILGVQNED